MDPEELAKKVKEQETIIKGLREDNAKILLKNKEVSDELATVKADRDKAVKEKDSLSQSVIKLTTEYDAFKKDSETKMAEVTKDAKQKIIAAEVSAMALQHGLVDRDALKLADLSKVEMAEDGTLKGADDLIKALKEAKPYLDRKSTRLNSSHRT